MFGAIPRRQSAGASKQTLRCLPRAVPTPSLEALGYRASHPSRTAALVPELGPVTQDPSSLSLDLHADSQPKARTQAAHAPIRTPARHVARVIDERGDTALLHFYTSALSTPFCTQRALHFVTPPRGLPSIMIPGSGKWTEAPSLVALRSLPPSLPGHHTPLVVLRPGILDTGDRRANRDRQRFVLNTRPLSGGSSPPESPLQEPKSLRYGIVSAGCPQPRAGL